MHSCFITLHSSANLPTAQRNDLNIFTVLDMKEKGFPKPPFYVWKNNATLCAYWNCWDQLFVTDSLLVKSLAVHALFVKKDQTNTCGENLDLQGHSIKSEETVKLLGVTLDYKQNFDPHISNICKKAAAQLNVLKRLKSFIGFAEREVLVQSFVFSNFNYCPLVWYFSSSKSLQKIERIQERALRFLFNDHKSSYGDLLIRSKKCTMQVVRQRTLCIEIFKTIKT